MRKILLCTAVASAVFATAPALAANLVSDQTFSTPAIHLGVNDFLSGKTFGPWSVIGSGCGHFGCAGIDVVNNNTFQAPPGGGNAVDLDGLAPGGITQTVALTTGDKYTLSFYLSGNPDGSPGDKKMTVSIGNLDQKLHYTLKPSNNDMNMNYILESFTFTANGNDLLSFTDGDPINSPYGAVIGDVSITPSVVASIPEPRTWLLLIAGFGVVGFMMRSRGKQSIAPRVA